MSKLEKITITKEEYNLLKIYERDVKWLVKNLAINHHQEYMNFLNIRMKKLENKINKLTEEDLK